jgi:hypothetical protein
MTNFRIKSVLIPVALLAVAVAPGSVLPASASSFSPMTCFAPSGVSVTPGGALKNTSANFVTVTCPIDKGDKGNIPLGFTWALGFEDTNGWQTKCTYRRFHASNPNAVESSSTQSTFDTSPSMMGRGWLGGNAVTAVNYYHDISCVLAPDHSITALQY